MQFAKYIEVMSRVTYFNINAMCQEYNFHQFTHHCQKNIHNDCLRIGNARYVEHICQYIKPKGNQPINIDSKQTLTKYIHDIANPDSANIINVVERRRISCRLCICNIKTFNEA